MSAGEPSAIWDTLEVVRLSFASPQDAVTFLSQSARSAAVQSTLILGSVTLTFLMMALVRMRELKSQHGKARFTFALRHQPIKESAIYASLLTFGFALTYPATLALWTGLPASTPAKSAVEVATAISFAFATSAAGVQIALGELARGFQVRWAKLLLPVLTMLLILSVTSVFYAKALAVDYGDAFTKNALIYTMTTLLGLIPLGALAVLISYLRGGRERAERGEM